MSIHATAWAWRQDADPEAKLVLLTIADLANERGEWSPINADLLAKRTGIGIGAMPGIFEDLERAHLMALHGGKMVRLGSGLIS